jgi:two-component system chemotaxis sensor kinase CheA
VAAADEILEAVAEVLARLAEELAFAEPGTDTALLPVNALLMDLEQVPAGALPASLVAALALPRGWIDATLDSSGKFDEATLLRLNAWHGWVLDCLMSEAAGLAAPEAPPELAAEASPATPPAAVQVPPPASVVAAAAPAVSVVAPVSAPVAAPVPVVAPVAAPVVAPVVAPVAAEALPAADVPTMVLRLPGDLDLLGEFHSESLELLRSIEQAVLTLEESPTAAEAINAIFRAFHTFKGSAGFLQLNALRDFAHELESLLEVVRSGEVKVSRPVIDSILAGADVLAECTREVGLQVGGVNPGQPIPVPSGPVLALVRAALRGEAPPPPVAAVAPAAVETPLAPQAAAEAPAQAQAQAVAPSAPVAAASAPAAAAAPAPKAAAPAHAAADNFVRLDASKLDDLVNLVGELVVAQAFVVESGEVRASPNLELAHAVRKLARITRELQHNAMSLRMVPVGGLFRKMTRLVRDLAASQGKQVRLVLKGEDTELDRQLVEKMGDPLIHMIRNSVDHGLETAEQRVAAGKDPTGTIELSAAHRHGGIVLRVSDDGRGLNVERLRAKAIEKKLLDPGVQLDHQAALELVFLPGLSTATAITDISGRGVGMDVVRGHIESLRGHVHIESELGAGAAFTIRLPLTLALIDGLLVGLGDERYIIPALAVRETFRPKPGAVSTVHEQGEMVAFRGEQLPVIRLGHVLRRPARAVQPEQGIIVVVESGNTVRALLVDEFLGKREIIIKNMGDTFAGQTLVAGGAILGDGSVGLILDVDSVVRAPRMAVPLATTTQLVQA